MNPRHAQKSYFIRFFLLIIPVMYGSEPIKPNKPFGTAIGILTGKKIFAVNKALEQSDLRPHLVAKTLLQVAFICIFYNIAQRVTRHITYTGRTLIKGR